MCSCGSHVPSPPPESRWRCPQSLPRPGRRGPGRRARAPHDGTHLAGTADGAIDARATVFIIRNHSGKCLEIENSSKRNGARAQQWTRNGQAGAKWKPGTLGGNRAEIINVRSGKCLEIENSSKRNGARAQQWTCDGQTAPSGASSRPAVTGCTSSMPVAASAWRSRTLQAQRCAGPAVDLQQPGRTGCGPDRSDLSESGAPSGARTPNPPGVRPPNPSTRSAHPCHPLLLGGAGNRAARPRPSSSGGRPRDRTRPGAPAILDVNALFARLSWFRGGISHSFGQRSREGGAVGTEQPGNPRVLAASQSRHRPRAGGPADRE